MPPNAWIEIDTGALTYDASVFRRAIPDSTRLGILVKANGYGHGMEIAARAAIAAGADQLMVVSIEEAFVLRGMGIETPLLIVYPIDPVAVDDAVRAGIEVSVSGVASTRRLLDAWGTSQARSAGGVLRLHVEVDSGMGRGGVGPADLPSVVAKIDASPATEIVGIWSHLADGSDPGRSADQVRIYDAALESVREIHPEPVLRHLAATEGVCCGTAPAYDMVRIGLGFYGELGVDVRPDEAHAALVADLRPAMTVVARPVRLEWLSAGSSVGYGSEWTASRRSLIATLPVGYADGYTRRYAPGGSALVRGRRVPIVGRVSMDSVCVDVTEASEGGEVRPDERFVLLGAQGDERITPVDLARLRGSIPNEVFCAFGPRLVRHVVGA